MATFTLQFDDVTTYAALVYRLKTLTQEIDNRLGHAGEIIFPERREIETILSDGSIGRWQIATPTTAIGFD
ncbi:hypothetical protein ABIB15_000905 [Marisediminicola sp. UYEF4]|uniref:hypothetical protein n=1 Tax=Marisediminicola sp. UYEF4 TaxID=1756384 RepID=UPI003394F549